MSGDPSWASVVLLVVNDNKADTTTSFADQSNSAHTMTTAANAKYVTAQAATGMTSSMLTAASGDFISTPDSTDFNVAAGDFTLEGFARWDSTAGFRTLYSKRTDFNTFGNMVVLRNGTTLGFFATSNATSWDISNGSSLGTVATNTWYHWAVSRSGNNIRLFLAGALTTTVVSAATITTGGAAACRVGGEAASQTGNQWLDSVELTKGVARYTAAFTPPSLPLATSTGVSTPMPLLRQFVH